MASEADRGRAERGRQKVRKLMDRAVQAVAREGRSRDEKRGEERGRWRSGVEEVVAKLEKVVEHILMCGGESLPDQEVVIPELDKSIPRVL